MPDARLERARTGYEDYVYVPPRVHAWPERDTLPPGRYVFTDGKGRDWWFVVEDDASQK